MHQNIYLSPILPPNRVNGSFAPDRNSSKLFWSMLPWITCLHISKVVCLKWFFYIVFWPKKLAALQHVKTAVKRVGYSVIKAEENEQISKLELQVNFTATELGSDLRGQWIIDDQVSTPEDATSPQPGHGNRFNPLHCAIKWISLQWLLKKSCKWADSHFLQLNWRPCSFMKRCDPSAWQCRRPVREMELYFPFCYWPL